MNRELDNNHGTTYLLPKSIMAVRYINPVSLEMWVISIAQT